MPEMKPSEVIREARNVLFERGWHQGGFYDPKEGAETGAVCAWGALNIACGERPAAPNELSCDALLRLEELVGPQGIPLWNDESGRTFDEVVEVFDKAEKIAEEREASDA